MTIQETIKYLESHGFISDDVKDMCIEALEKQIPKKPNYEADGYADGKLVYDSAECPTCGHIFEYDINDWQSNYCLECGQKLDWSE